MRTADVIERFHRDGYVKLEGLLDPAELAALQEETAWLIAQGGQGRPNPTDYFYDPGDEPGEVVFHRIQNVMDKSPGNPNTLLAAVANPRILRLVEALLGPDFVCDGDALVFKLPGNGREVPVHADNDPAHPGWSANHLAFNVDLYLDESTPQNGCLLVAPGSHNPRHSFSEITALGFDFPGLVPVPAAPGDVIIHCIDVVHGSHTSRSSKLRRTLYYEFQGIEAAKKDGLRPGVPVTDAWVQDRIRLLMRAAQERRSVPYGAAETPFDYKAPALRGVRLVDGAGVKLRTPLGVNRYF